MTGTEERMIEAIRTIQAKGTSLEEIAARFGTYKQNLSAFMLGKRGAQIRWLETACTEYGFKPEWLLTGKGEKTRQ